LKIIDYRENNPYINFDRLKQMELDTMIRPVTIKALKDYKIWIEYSNGESGVVDLSEYVGKGIFKRWEDYSVFEKVKIGSSGEILWDDDIDLCPDSIYLKLTRKNPEDLFPNLKENKVNA